MQLPITGRRLHGCSRIPDDETPWDATNLRGPSLKRLRLARWRDTLTAARSYFSSTTKYGSHSSSLAATRARSAGDSCDVGIFDVRDHQAPARPAPACRVEAAALEQTRRLA